MTLSKTLAVLVCAGLLSAGVLGAAYAQDADEIDPNAGVWSAPTASSEGSTIPDAKVPPLSIAGCWSGEVTDTGDGAGTATFQFHQRSHKKQLVGSTFDFEWSDGALAMGPIQGSVSSTGFKFKAKLFSKTLGRCQVSASAMGTNTALTGTAVFVGPYCSSIFQNVTFSITAGCP